MDSRFGQRLPVLAAALCLLLVPLSGFAGVYRWVDSDGVVHYSDRPASGAEVEDITPPAERRRPLGAANADPAPEPQTNGQTRRVRAQQCEKARERAARYREAESLRATQDDGSQRLLSAEEQVQAIVRAEQQVAALCN